jgi:putative cardiolipin synthase
VLEAADRGVRVRMLLDDLDARAKTHALLALDSHPNIEVRLFHPFASRTGSLAMFGEMMGSFGRLNRRMHAKNWIVDNRLALSGGRNVGDEYFTASDEANFADLDYAVVGPTVRDISASFDRYWNHGSVYPIAALGSPDELAAASLDPVRAILREATAQLAGSPYAGTFLSTDRVQRMVRGEFSFIWTRDYKFAADLPDKDIETGPLASSSVLALLLPQLQQARREILIASPYFVPGEAGTRTLAEIARRGVRVRILTNSLAANDVAAVHGGYTRYRRALLEAGIELWELKPHDDAQVAQSFLGASNASLHAKALAIDHDSVFVGSYNLDPRSTRLNNEQGVLVTHPVVGTAFAQLFARETEGARAWRVSLHEGQLQWSDGQRVLDHEPDASLSRRFQAWLARVLPVEPML